MLKKARILFTIFICCLLLLSISSKAQDTVQKTNLPPPRHLPPLPLVPQYPGGRDSLAKFLKDNVHYPAAARKHHISGTVEVDFMVDEQGNLSDFKVRNPLGYGCDKEALRVAKKMKKWIPARKGRDPMVLGYHVSITFTDPEKK